MSTDLVEHRSDSLTPMQLISDGAGKLDTEQMRALMELQRDWQRDRAAEAFCKAVTEFQSKCPVVHKCRRAEGSDKFGGYNYAGYDDIMRQVSPLLKECQLAISFASEQVNNQLKITCRIRHGIHFEDHALTVPVPSTLRVSDTQKMGAALSYAKRYALCAALNIVVSEEDNDAEKMFEGITDEQLITIEEWIGVMGDKFKVRPFLKWLGIEKMSELKAEQYGMVMTELQRKAKELGVSR